VIFIYKIDKLYQGDKKLEKKNIFILLLLTALFYLLNIPSRVFEWFFLFFSLALILVYRMEKNMYFHKVLLFWCGGTLFAFGVGKFIAIRQLPEFTMEKLLLGICMVLILGVDFVFLLRYDRSETRQKENVKENLFRERTYDLERLCSFIQAVPIVGMDAPWGDGKSFLVNMIYQDEAMKKRFTFIQIDLLTCDLNEIESILLGEIERVLQNNGIYSFHGRKTGKLFKDFSLSNVFCNVLQEEGEEVSSTFIGFEKDVRRLDKDILIVFEDIDRIKDPDIVRKIFAIAEKLAGDKIHILYQYEFSNLPWNKAFLEKYIPYEVAVTELSFERIIVALWKKCGMQQVTGLKIEDVKYIMRTPVSNVILTDIHELKNYALVLRTQRVAIRNVELFLNEFVLIYKMNERYRQKENAKWLAMILFIKHFLYEQMEQIKMGKLLSESLLLTYKNETFDVETLIGRYHTHIYSENECIQIVKDPVNNPVIWTFAVLRYDFAIPKEDRNDPRWFANESDGVMRRMQHNEQVNRFLWNIKGNGNSEYTDMEWLAKEICETVLNKVGNPRKKAWDKIWKDAFQMENEKNNGTVQLFGETAMLSAFKALYVTGISTENWIRMIKYYFAQEEAQAITVDMIENLNFVSLMNKDVLIAVARGFVQCKVVGNMNEQKAFARFLKNYLQAIWGLGYARRRGGWYIAGMYSEEVLQKKEFVVEVLADYKRALQDGEQSALFAQMKEEFQLLVQFVDKLSEIIRHNRNLKAREMQWKKGETRTVYEHDDLFRKLKEEASNIDPANEAEREAFIKELEQLYREGKLNPEEYRIIEELLLKKG